MLLLVCGVMLRVMTVVMVRRVVLRVMSVTRLLVLHWCCRGRGGTASAAGTEIVDLIVGLLVREALVVVLVAYPDLEGLSAHVSRGRWSAVRGWDRVFEHLLGQAIANALQRLGNMMNTRDAMY